MGKGYLVITRKDGKYFKRYSPKSRYKFYSHIEPTLTKAKMSKAYFRKKGVYAMIYKNFLR